MSFSEGACVCLSDQHATCFCSVGEADYDRQVHFDDCRHVS